MEIFVKLKKLYQNKIFFLILIYVMIGKNAFNKLLKIMLVFFF